jgi:hypothetical protein
MRDGEGDSDDLSGTYYDRDDSAILSFGSAAGTADANVIAKLVRRYYAVSATGDGVAACRLLYAVVAESLPEDYGEERALRGDTCAAVMSKMLERRHRKALEVNATLAIGAVRVEGDHGYVLVGQGGVKPRRFMRVRREGDVWKINELTSSSLP